jgi:phosphatidylinositol kinase/protein kinase (PI-3  family)
MQLFKLINTLLNHQREAFSRNLHLLPYEVIPLSPSAGLLSWVPNTQQYVHPSYHPCQCDEEMTLMKGYNRSLRRIGIELIMPL